MKFAVFCFLALSLVLNISSRVSANVQDKSTPVFRETNGVYSINVEIGTPGQQLKVALSHLKEPIIVSNDCVSTCSGRSLYNALQSSTSSNVTAITNLASAYGNFTGTRDLTDKTKIAGKTVNRANWHLASSANLTTGTNYVGLLPVTGTADTLSLETVASLTASKTFAINFAKDSSNVGSGRLWMDATDPSIALSSVAFMDVVKFRGFSMMRFKEGQLGSTTLGCQLGPIIDCDATLNLASNFSTLGRNLDDIATSLGLTKRSNQYVVACNAVQNLPNLVLKINDKQLVFKPEHYVVRNQVQGTEECLFGFVSSTLRDFRLGLNLIRHLYIVYRETTVGTDQKLQYGYYNVDMN